MSNTAPTTPAVPGLAGLTSARPPRSETARVLLGTFGQPLAIIAAVWLGVILFFAVFAPFLASSFPLLLKLKGQGWSSPLLRHLTPVDASVLVAAVALGVLCTVRRLRGPHRLIVFVGVMAVAIPLSIFVCKQPAGTVYDIYRGYHRDGLVEHAIYAPIPFSPNDRLADQFEKDNPNPHPPSAVHWLGTEINGSDVLSRMIHACRIAMAVGFISTGIAVVVGVVLGGLMGYFSGWVDLVGMRLVEIFDAIPRLYLLLTVVAFWRDEASMLLLIMVIIGLTGWSGYALFIRAEFLKLRQQDFVQAAIATGLPLRSILFRHMLPNGITPVLVSASFGIAGAMNVENILSFLGIGLVEEPSWGALLNQATSPGGNFRWWIATAPGLALFLSMFAFIIIGEAMRDVIDPYTNRNQH
ncbi:MAG: ABC transporter permease [Planctomycetes bacterium]|nr:ABC transporter permease [Planctomycetota bacterium]